MCGIAGVVFADRSREVPLDLLRRMTDTLRFRGPDAEGAFCGQGAGLGHRRLSVIDLAESRQPMTDPSGRWTISFNGEIYNFAELREELQGAGHVFRTGGDTEVLLRGYLHWGTQVLDRAVGMFAFAIWDARDEVLVLARDRLGVKPLYWAALPEGGLIFASELTAILASRLLEPRLNLAATARYLALGYVVGRESILEGIHRLPAAHCLFWTRGGGLRITSYWSMIERWLTLSQQGSEGDPVASFSAGLDRAVQDRLISDVPLGVLLSGGLDSTAVTAFVGRHRPAVQTFSCGFQEASYDELAYARLAARELGTRHHDQVLGCSRPDLLLEVAARLDEPFADTSILPTYALCQMAREHVTVALSGDGADELLAGYVTHLADRIHVRVHRLPGWLLAVARWTANWLPDSRRKLSAAFQIKQFVSGANLPACDAHAWWRMLCDPSELNLLFHPDRRVSEVSPFAPFRDAYQEATELPPLERMLYVDYSTWLVDDILFKVDRASMAHGLEVRSPFLDHRLFELCAALPARWKLRGWQRKVVLSEAVRGQIPTPILRRRKAGFNAPVSQWLSTSWREVLETHLSSERIQQLGVLNPVRVRELVDEHLSGRRDRGYLLFTLLQLALWLEKSLPWIRL